MLTSLRQLCAEPQLVADVFVNYDCDGEAPPLFERTLQVRVRGPLQGEGQHVGPGLMLHRMPAPAAAGAGPAGTARRCERCGQGGQCTCRVTPCQAVARGLGTVRTTVCNLDSFMLLQLFPPHLSARTRKKRTLCV